MSEVALEAQKDITPEHASALASIKAIQGLFHAVNAASFPIRYHDAVLIGMTLLQEINNKLVASVPQEIIDREKVGPDGVGTVN